MVDRGAKLCERCHRVLSVEYKDALCPECRAQEREVKTTRPKVSFEAKKPSED